MMKEGVPIETSETNHNPPPYEEISTTLLLPQGGFPSSHDDSSGTANEPPPPKVWSNKGETDPGLKPEFRVGEISERDESRVSSIPVENGIDNLPKTVSDATTIQQEPVNGDETILSISPVEHTEDDTQLSLVSWYSEPGDAGGVLPLQPCCMERCGVKPTSVHSAVSGQKSGKENKTPSIPGTGSSIPSNKLQLTMRAQNPDKRNRRLDSRGCKPVGNSIDINGTITNGHENLECHRCSRKSKSGSTTPAIPSRSPKRQIAPKKPIPNLKKPIKSILRTSSGSEKQSSMDSVDSCDDRGHNPDQMTRSDLGQRLRTKFKLDGLTETRWSDGDFTGLKRIERYATIRIRKPHVIQSNETQEASSGTVSPSDLMTKSLSYLKTPSPTGDSEMTPAPFQRHGSLKSRRAGPTMQPCATRTSALRLLKIQEKNAKLQNGGEKSNSESSDVYSNSNHLVPSKRPLPSKNSVRKVFSKLSSAFGHTASSSQKRLRQERGIQTEPILILRTMESRGGASFSGNGSPRSPTPASPFPTSPDVQWEEMAPADEVIRLRQELNKYKAKVAKYQHIYSEAEHLRDVEREYKEMINFLQDEKSMLTESLAEAEDEILVLSEKLETQSIMMQKLEDELIIHSENYGSKMKEVKENGNKESTEVDPESIKTKELEAETTIL